MSEIDKLTEELDRLLGLTPAKELRTPNDTVCSLDIEMGRGKIFRPLSSDEELELALRQGPEAEAEKTKYSKTLFKASKVLEKNYQLADAEKVLEKLVIFDGNSNCFIGVAAEHLFHLALSEERLGVFEKRPDKIWEAEFHFSRGTEETPEERYMKSEKVQLAERRGEMLPTDPYALSDTPRDMRKAENYAALARLAKRKGLDKESEEFLIRAYGKDETPDKYLQKAADPKNFEDLYFD